MLRSLSSLIGSTIHAEDGNLGHVHDFLFDDRGWRVRYLVVETGSWFSSRQVLVAPAAAGQPDWDQRILPVSLTMDQIRNSPDVDTARPVSRQEEIAISEYYGWPTYWSMEPPLVPVFASPQTAVMEEDTHLHSSKDIISYQVKAADGELGQIDDLIMEDSNWYVRYVVARTGSWMNGQKVLLTTRCVESISWPDRQVVLAQAHDDL
ncbi:PRC-barrel domain-containing protein [Paludibaculum fermentans]|uniref:PRC-barrel domain-containing protein n=1 Tax=Paludibaculum fermentans TaxID=1473598 RepID=A0A7S7NKV3_PALFE|nr:PRC-barrel domain-containing protein [Paludibaculum fermentans]QOY85505.1 PRC-barrel domain-containing protein [Paludibaculum fermentans]